MATTDTKETRERLLDVAEERFGERGIPEVSLREITSLAEANIAAVNYHFGSKDGLVREVFARRMKPLNEMRIELLREAESVEEVIRAFVGPTLKFSRKHPFFMRLAARYHMETRADCREIFESPGFHELVSLIREGLIRNFPDAPESALWWGMHFVVGTMLHTWMGGDVTERLSNGKATWDSDEKMIERMVAFGAAGVRAVVDAATAEVAE
jgi:AcrR family transcriptional regulator